jgi:1-acyl-sn-glycerol-3-phosphate acyltransferase
LKTIRQELEEIKLGSEYSYLSTSPSILSRVIKKIFEIYCKLLFRFYCPLKVYGRENIPSSSFIFCSNHNSHMDSGILMLASGKPFIKFAMMAAKDYFFDNKNRKYFLSLLMNLIPIDRDADKQSMIEYLAACKEFLKDNNSGLIIYPEGTRSKTGQMQRFKKGPAMISAELGVPVVPAFISGSFRAWPKGRVFMKPKSLTVWIGKPIYPDKFFNGSPSTNGQSFSTYRNITNELEKKVHELMELKNNEYRN